MIDYKDPDTLNRLYWEEFKTLDEIAALARVNAITIRNWMIRHGIRIRSIKESRLTERFQNQLGEGRSEYCNAETLMRLYVDEGMSGPEIATLAGVDRHTVVQWLRSFGIPVRTNKQSKNTKRYKAHISGTNHPNFKDGKRALHTGWGYPIRSLYGDERQRHRCDAQGRVPEHIYVMENHIGRPLTSSEVVHHRNFDREDSRIENLILFPSQAVHSSYHKYLERVGAFHLGLIPEEPTFEFPSGTIVGTQT